MIYQDKIDWKRVPLDPALLKRLNTCSDKQGFIQAGGHVALTIATGCLCVWVWAHHSLWLLIPCLYLHGSVQQMLNAGAHELAHERVFKTVHWNRFFMALINFVAWGNHRFFALPHKEHHRFTLNAPMDREVVLPQKLEPWFPGILINVVMVRETIKFAWNTSRGVFVGEWEKDIMAAATEKERSQVIWCSRFLLINHSLLFIFSMISGLWILPLVVSFGNAFGALLFRMTHLPQHFGLISGSNDFRLSCRTYISNPVIRFLYWNMNYHIEHHMYAAVPCYNLPELHEVIVSDLPHVNRSLIDTWVELLEISRRQKIEPDYVYRQKLPGEDEVVELRDEPVKAQEKVPVERIQSDYKVWECSICAFVYDEAKGMPEEGIPAGTRWEEVPENWSCPDCGVSKEKFRMVERQNITASV